jgi:hypothetical protein
MLFRPAFIHHTTWVGSAGWRGGVAAAWLAGSQTSSLESFRMNASEQLVFWTVVLARFLVPLAIPRFPLPGILAALLIDAADQSIFQQFTSMPLTSYQGYDKALDIYYLSIAYISTLRNWSNHLAFMVGRLLFYYRLVGVALFELWQLRVLLLIFPNTFEYFFIFYEAWSLRRDPIRLTRKALFGATAFIWVLFKLPQEYWIHVAQLDATDWIKTNLFKAPADAAWSAIFMNEFWVILIGVALGLLVLMLAWRLLAPHLAPADRKLAFSSAVHRLAFTPEQMRRARASEADRIIDSALVEKVVLISLLSVIFAQVLPDVRAQDWEIAVAVAFVITINTAVSHWLARRGSPLAFALREFAVLAVVNLALILAYALLALNSKASIDLGNTLFFALMLTLMVTLFDRYRQVYLMRFPSPD